jgi:sugar O-acyltransferase (sialic acid O-acetyltransferase NeuD family)
MAKVIIFGNGHTAELAHYYLTNDSKHEVIAFTVTSNLISQNSFMGLPLIAFEEVNTLYPPSEYDFFAPASGKNMSIPRRNFYEEIKAKGYRLISYVHSKAVTHDNPIGDNCFILELVNLQPFVAVESNVVIWSNVHIGHHSTIGSHSFIVSGSVISGSCKIGEHSYIGPNSTILQDLTLAEGTFVSTNSVLRESTEAWSVYDGNPAKRRKISSKKLRYL